MRSTRTYNSSKGESSDSLASLVLALLCIIILAAGIYYAQDYYYCRKEEQIIETVIRRTIKPEFLVPVPSLLDPK